MEKTIKEWLEELPEPYRTQAIDNSTEKSLIRTHAKSLLVALDIAFDWGKSRQVYDYWYKLHDELEADQFGADHKEDQQYEAEQEDKGDVTND